MSIRVLGVVYDVVFGAAGRSSPAGDRAREDVSRDLRQGALEAKYGLCKLFVGVADNVAFLVTDGDLDAIMKATTEGNAGGPRCERADRAATMALDTLKEGR